MDLWNRIPKKRRKWVGGALAALAILLVLLLALRPQGDGHRITGENLLKDGRFEELAAKGSGAWYEDAYVSRSTYTAYDFVAEEDGGDAVKIHGPLLGGQPHKAKAQLWHFVQLNRHRIDLLITGFLRQHRTTPVHQMRRPAFRQIA